MAPDGLGHLAHLKLWWEEAPLQAAGRQVRAHDEALVCGLIRPGKGNIELCYMCFRIVRRLSFF